MFFSRLCYLFLGIVLWGMSCLAWSAPEKDFLFAREAYQKGQFDRFEKYARKLPDGYPLNAYLDYWRLVARQEPAELLQGFKDRYPDSPLIEKVHASLARLAAERGDWAAFQGWYAQLTRPDPDNRCFAQQAALAMGRSPDLAVLVPLYRSARDLPSNCEALYEQLLKSAALPEDDRYGRMRLALDAGNLRLARQLDAGLSADGRMAADALDRVQRDPFSLVRQAGESRGQREVALYALTQLAKKDPIEAALLWEGSQARYPEGEQRYGWGQIATQAARRHDPIALDWFRRADYPLSEAQLLWKARACLRAGRWSDLLQTILVMPRSMQDEPVWRYWKGRAYKALNTPLSANRLFAVLSREIHYYGLLAEEELPVRLETRADSLRVTDEHVRAAAAMPGIQRALMLRDMGLMVNAVAEWDWAIRGQSDAVLLAAAELARRSEWYDRAIITAEKTRDSHDFDLRYLTPYRDLAQAHARQNGLDEAWVYGLMRQESRFVSYAQSGVGARGLMQIMPDTAKWIARQLGLGKNEQDRYGQPETNIRFGTYYLRRILDGLQGSPVLATAGYNAGPGRARKWQADVPLEGAIYVETIPFGETRDYVKKVMANAMYYSQRLGVPKTSLKERLGWVPARQTNLPSGGSGASPDTGGDTSE